MKTKLKFIAIFTAGFVIGDSLCTTLNNKILSEISRTHEEKLMKNFSEGHSKGWDAALQSSVVMAERLEQLGFEVTYKTK